LLQHLFTIAKLWKQPRCPTTDKWIKKMWYLYTVEIYSVTKNEILSFTGIWMELENIMLSEVRFNRPKATYFLSYVEYRPNTNKAIL
jgi:hypothetical protein